MTPGGKPTSPLEEALRKEPRLMALVVGVAKKRTRGSQQAEDFAQEATTRAIVRSRKTGEPKPPPVTTSMVLLFIGSVLNTLTWNTWRAEKRRPPPRALDESNPKHRGEAPPDTEQLLGRYYEETELDRMETQVREALAADADDHAIPLAMFALAAQGVEKNADFAARIPCRVEDVENARKRLARVGDRIRGRAAEDRPS